MLAGVDTFDKLVEALDGHLMCQAEHSVRNVERCSIEVVALFYCCVRERVMVCQEAVDAIATLGRMGYCAGCGSRISDCWHFIYI